MRQPQTARYPVVISLVACRHVWGAAVREDLHPVRWAGRPAVVARAGPVEQKPPG
jgi:hypothetical protein